MMVNFKIFLGLLLVGLLLVGACSVSNQDYPDCLSDSDCLVNESCVDGSCVVGVVNSVPVVSAGPDVSGVIGEKVVLSGSVNDDGLPNPPGELVVGWSKVSGPGDVKFSDKGKVGTSVVFDVPGVYVLRLSADDGALVGDDTVNVSVNGSGSVFSVGSWVEAEDGRVVGSMRVSDDGKFVFTPVNDVGSVSFDFDVVEAGKYELETYVYAKNGTRDSFFVGLEEDSPEGNPLRVWDVGIGKGFVLDVVNWRNGEKWSSGKRVDPVVWTLSEGVHRFYFYGREAFTDLDRVRLVKVSDSSGPSCFDGVMNGDEDGVDCGGNCPKCTVESEEAWVPIGPGAGGWFRDIKISPTDSNRVYLLGDRSGFYYSENKGESWTQAKGTMNHAMEEIAVHPNGKDVIIATNGGIYKSVDRGKTFTWKKHPCSFPPKSNKDGAFKNMISAITYDESNPDIVWAGSGGTHPHNCLKPHSKNVRADNFGIFKSMDGGETWVSRSNGLNRISDTKNNLVNTVASIATHPTNPNIVYAALCDGLYKTIDGGYHWKKIHDGSVHSGVYVDKKNPNIVLTTRYWEKLGVYRSTDAGKTWRKLGTSNGLGDYSHYQDFHSDYDNDNIIYLGNTLQHNGFYKSTDHGKTWHTVPGIEKGECGNSKRCSDQVTGFSVKGDLIFRVQANPYRSTDGGKTYESVAQKKVSDGYWETRGPEILVTRQVISHPDNPNRLFLLSMDNCFYDSNDGGKSWKYNMNLGRYKGTTNGFGFESGHWMAFDPDDHNIAYLAIGNNNNNLEEIMKSTDGGETWSKINTNLKEHREILHLEISKEGTPSHRVMFLSLKKKDNSDKIRGIYKSTDSGKTWYKKGPTLSYVESIAVDPNNPKIVWAAAKISGLYKSSDSGETWKEIANDIFPDPQFVAIKPDNSKVILVATNGWNHGGYGGIYRSEDGGNTWERVLKDSVNDRLDMSSVVFDPNNPNIVYAGAKAWGIYQSTWIGGGIWKSTDAGKTWKKMSDDSLKSRVIESLTISPKDSTLFVATDGGAAFKFKK